MKIGELAASCGVSTDTLRYYEKIGLLPRPARRGNGYRDYGAEDAGLVQLIRGAQGLGFSLQEIAEIVVQVGRQEVTRETVEARLKAKIAATDAHIVRLQHLRETLLATLGQLVCAPGTPLRVGAITAPAPAPGSSEDLGAALSFGGNRP